MTDTIQTARSCGYSAITSRNVRVSDRSSGVHKISAVFRHESTLESRAILRRASSTS